MRRCQGLEVGESRQKQYKQTGWSLKGKERERGFPSTPGGKFIKNEGGRAGKGGERRKERGGRNAIVGGRQRNLFREQPSSLNQISDLSQ